MAQPFGLAGVMGWPVSHSRSPLMHNLWLKQHGIAGVYVPLPVQPERLGDALRGLPALGFAGCNLTIPHKVAAMAYMDEIDPLARRMGAMNLVVVGPEGRLTGFNTDGFGFWQSLVDAQPQFRAEAGPVVVLGAGGAARAVVLSLLERGAPRVRLLNRTEEKAQQLASELSGAGAHGLIDVLPWSQREAALEGCALLVNTTSLGMQDQGLGLATRRLAAHRTGVRRDLCATGNAAVEAGARTRPCDGERFGHADEPGPTGVPGLVWRDARDHA